MSDPYVYEDYNDKFNYKYGYDNLADLYTKTTVTELKKDHGIRLIPGVSQGEYALDLCGVSAVYAQSIAADDLPHAKIDGRKAFAVTEIDSPYRAADVALEFSRYYPHDGKIWYTARARMTRASLRPSPSYRVRIIRSAAW